MSVAIVDNSTVTQFVFESDAFERSVDKHFDMLDIDGNGELSRDELQRRHGKFSSTEFELQSKDEISDVYDALFEKFDVKKKGTLDREEFKMLMKEIMLAKARGMGHCPVLIIVQHDSLVYKAIEFALSKES